MLGDASYTESGIPQAGERHSINTKGSVVVDHNRRGIKASVHAQRDIDIAAEYCRLESEWQAVSRIYRVAEIVIRVHANDWPKYLRSTYLRVNRWIKHHGTGITTGAQWIAAAEQFSAAIHRLQNPFVNPLNL